MASDVRRQPTGASRLSGVIALLVVTLAVCTALYVRGGDFAAWLDGLIAQGRAAVG
ncbi:MAG: hypothetical protein JNK94_05260 [Hyphomonadaceae bacterium]|nr:hypothetical protein [Hyphomonadaceae bacterium]MBX3511860.1 hypothetical protein [Hyphomonadaceae bacterium]